MFVRIDFKITDSANPGIINFLAFILNKQTNHIPLWHLCGLSGKVIRWDAPIHKGTGMYNAASASLNNLDNSPYGKVVYSKDILRSTKGERGKLIDVNGNFRDAEFMSCVIVQQQAFIPSTGFAA